MAMHEVDLEKKPFVTAKQISPALTTPVKGDSLYVYQTLIGDIHASADAHNESLCFDIVKRECRAKLYTVLSSIAFGVLIAAQIILCLSIAIGAQAGLSDDEITILAGVNTGVAATIAVLKGLGLPEKKIVQRHKLQKLAEKMRFTTRRIQAGLEVDAAREAEEAFMAHDEVEDEAMVLPNVGDASAPLPAKSGGS